MKLLHTIQLEGEQKIEVFSKTTDPYFTEIIRKYYAWSNGWCHKVTSLKGDMPTKKLSTLVREKSEVILTKGICENIGSPSCEGRIRITVKERENLVKVIRKNEDVRCFGARIECPDGIARRRYSTEIHKAFLKCRNFCTPCLEESLINASQEETEEGFRINKENEKLQRIKEMEKINRLKFLDQHIFTASHYTTGFVQLDKLLNGGLNKGALNVMGSYLSNETYNCLLTIINHFARSNEKPVFVSLCKRDHDMKKGLYANQIGVHESSLDRLKDLSDNQSENLEKAINTLLNVKLASLIPRTMDDLESLIDKYHSEGHTIFFIDSLQDIAIGKADSQSAKSMEQVFTANCRRLNDLILSRSITVIGIALLNRNIPRRDNNPKFPQPEVTVPRLEDIRDSNILEHLASNIIFLQCHKHNDPTLENRTAKFFVALTGNTTPYTSCDIDYDPETGIFSESNTPFQQDDIYDREQMGIIRTYNKNSFDGEPPF